MAIPTLTLEKLIRHLKDALSAFPQLEMQFSPMYLAKISVTFSLGKDLKIDQEATRVPWTESSFNDLGLCIGYFDYTIRHLFSPEITSIRKLISTLEELLPFEGTVTCVQLNSNPSRNQLLNPENPLRLSLPLGFQTVDAHWRQTKLASEWMELKDQLMAIQSTLKLQHDWRSGKDALETLATLTQNILLKRTVSPTIDHLPIYLFSAKDTLLVCPKSDYFNDTIKETYPEFAKLPLAKSIIEDPSTVCRSAETHPRVFVFPHEMIELAIRKYQQLGEEIGSLLKGEPITKTITTVSGGTLDGIATGDITFNSRNVISASAGDSSNTYIVYSSASPFACGYRYSA